MRNWINLVEGKWWDESPTITLYHGTSSAFLPVIREKGLLPPKEDVKAYAEEILAEYIPKSEWTPQLVKDVTEHAVRPLTRRGDRGAVLYFMDQPNTSVSGYARSYAKHGGEIAHDVYTCACIFVNPELGEHFGRINWKELYRNGPLKPRFEAAYPIIVEVEIPKEWCIVDNDLNRMKENCQKLWNDEVDWARETGSLEALYDEVFDGREVRVSRPIPPEMIVSIKTVDDKE